MIRELEPLSAVVALGHIIPCGLQPQDGLAPQKSFVVALGPTVALGHRLFYFLTGGYRPHYNYIYATNFSIIIQ